MNPTTLNQFQAMESKIDSLLPRSTQTLKPESLVGLVSDYAAIVSDQARREVPILPSEAEIRRGLELASRPVFICGVPRSGTTLVQGLLHSHDRCLVLPSEGSFLTNFQPNLRSLKNDDAVDWLVKEWVSRFIRINSTGSHWILGRSSDGHYPYVKFAQSLIGWNIALARNMTKENICSIHTAVMLAFWSESESKKTATHWVDKTPYNEFHARQLLKCYPGAKFIHVIRDPRAVIASRLRLQRRIGLGDHNFRQILAEIRRSLKLALDYASILGRDRYLLVRYERLAALPQKTMEGVVEFLEIERTRCQFRPILHGNYSVKNTSYTDDLIGSNPIYLSSLDRFHKYLSAGEQQLISAALAVYAGRCGYSEISAPIASRLVYVSTELFNKATRAARRILTMTN